MANDKMQQPDTSEPSDERKAELEAAYEQQKDTNAPYKGVKIQTLGELRWIMRQRNWSEKNDLPDSIEPPNLTEADLRDVNLTGVNLSRVNLAEADLRGANLAGVRFLGANLTGVKLNGANLLGAKLRGVNLIGASLLEANLTQASLSWVNLTEVKLKLAILIRAKLSGANLIGADLSGADLSDADLSGAILIGTNLARTLMNAGTLLDFVELNDTTVLIGVRWNSAPLDSINWSQFPRLGDEPVKQEIAKKPAKERAEAYLRAARAYHGLVVALELQGLTQTATRFHQRERMMERLALRTTWRTWGQWFFRWFLNTLSGEGEKPGRAFLSYILLILNFAGIYSLLWRFGLTKENLSSWDSPFILSLTSFHGRTFFAGNLNITDWVARVGAIEAVFGLFIEIIFIATFSRRFLGD